jgi:hypothetical protein
MQQISEADATIRIYLENSVGIGEHPQHLLMRVDKLTRKDCKRTRKTKRTTSIINYKERRC